MGSKLNEGRHAEKDGPWQAGVGRFTKIDDPVRIGGTIRYAKENHSPLTLVADGGKSHQESLLVSINDGSLQIDKPLEWLGEPNSFRVFFRDRQRNWNYFPAGRVSYSPFALTVAMPEELYSMQRRSCHRVRVPIGTRALVKNGNQALSTVFVQDLSAAGMLMYNDPAEGEYATDSIINDIVVSIPSSGRVGEKSNVRTVLPLIGQGRIVRSYIDSETKRPCYGVSFQYDSSYVKETLDQIVSEMEKGAFEGDLYS